MAPKKKKNKLLVKLISGAGTGFFYLFKKTPQIAQKKLALRKFDPIVNQYVVFNEAKLKFSTSTKPSTFTPIPDQIRPKQQLFGRYLLPCVALAGIGYYFAAPSINRVSTPTTANLRKPYSPEQELSRREQDAEFDRLFQQIEELERNRDAPKF